MQINRRNRMRKKGIILDRKNYYIVYTLMFCVLAFFVFMPFLIHNKSLVYFGTNGGGDGLVSHYNTFVYYGKYLRSIIRTFLSTGKIVIPMWDMHIGYGQDIFQTLWYYAIGDPFAFLSVFIPTRFSEIGYCLMIIFEIYCAGLAFSYYAQFMNRKYPAVLIAALIYAFAAYPLVISTLHPYFTLPMIMLPLLLTGVEKLLKANFSPFYVFIITLSAFSCFYFFYMLCIFVFLYALIRYVELNKPSVKGIFLYFIRFAWNSLLGIGMAAVMLFPVIYSLISTERVSISNYIPPVYSLGYYQKLLLLVMAGMGDSYNHQGFTAIGLMCMLALFVLAREKRQYRSLAVSFTILILFECIPYIGHVLNGFAYVTNRWIWALGFCLAFTIATILPELRTIENKEWVQITVIAVVYLVIAISFVVNWTILNFINILIFILLWFAVKSMKKHISWSDRWFYPVLLSIGSFSLIVNAQIIYAPNQLDYLKNFGKAGTAYQSLIEASPAYQVSKKGDDSVFRFDTAGISEGRVKRNSAMLLKMNGTSYYYSTGGAAFTPFINAADLNYSIYQSYTDLDTRSYLEALLGVKYVVVKNENEKVLPYGFDKCVEKGDVYSVYETANTLPLAFFTGKIIDYNQYENAEAIEKQEMMLQGLAVDGQAESGVEYKPECRKIAYEITQTDGVEIHDDAFIVTEEKGSISLEIKDTVSQEGEWYFQFKGLNFHQPEKTGNWFEKHTFDRLKSGALTISMDNGLSSVVLVYRSKMEHL